MRTTLTLDDDVLRAVRDRARREKRSAGDVLSELARAALNGAPVDPNDQPTIRNGWSVLPHRGPPVTSELVARLLDEEP